MMKKRFQVWLLVIGVGAAMSIAVPLYAESIFLKDGSIIEGEIVRENDRAMDIRLQDGAIKTIQRKDILRTLISTRYKTKMYIMMNDKTVLSAYIVEEDADHYICRTDLQSPDEFSIRKDAVLLLSKTPPQMIIDEKAKQIAAAKTTKTREQNITWRAPLLRVGYAPMVRHDEEVEFL